MAQLLNGGIRFGNYHMTASYITGGTFSLDGIHPSARGYAYIANQFLKAIEATYGSSIPEVNPGNYQIQYPQTLN
jgi:lysophospholipase L1-like esterase